MSNRRRAVEGRMLRELGMTQHAQERLRNHNLAQTDWHGWCRVCRTHFSGSIVQLCEPCPKCGASREGKDGTSSR